MLCAMECFTLKYFLVSCLLCFSLNVNAGAWGVGSFENDSAWDWFAELSSASSEKTLASTFEEVSAHAYIDVDICSGAIAAADILASADDVSLSNLPVEVKKWVAKSHFPGRNDLKIAAIKALKDCSDPRKSELAQLWGESESTEWIDYINELIGRLK